MSASNSQRADLVKRLLEHSNHFNPAASILRAADKWETRDLLREAADALEKQSGPAESECHRVLRIIATTSITDHGKYIENCAAVFQQMAKNALAKSDATSDEG